MNESNRGKESRTLLVVDDDEALRTRLVQALVDRGLSVSAAANYDEAMAAAFKETPELALVDLRLPGRSGLDIVRRLKELDDTTNVVVLTGYGSLNAAVESLRLGATTYLTKPVDADQILAAFDGTNGSGRSAAIEPAPAGSAATELPPASSTLTRREWEHIQRVLRECGGDVSQAARRLKMHRRSFERKLAKNPGPDGV